jgi:hypothetical protein
MLRDLGDSDEWILKSGNTNLVPHLYDARRYAILATSLLVVGLFE